MSSIVRIEEFNALLLATFLFGSCIDTVCLQKNECKGGHCQPFLGDFMQQGANVVGINLIFEF